MLMIKCVLMNCVGVVYVRISVFEIPYIFGAELAASCSYSCVVAWIIIMWHGIVLLIWHLDATYSPNAMSNEVQLDGRVLCSVARAALASISTWADDE
mmetsp:Transcript_43617/g.105866  ORF Transcript_43617/g.105866 Transcript_43617/m.105866 type:complete len:98 (-) Transcript_43617:130-423(-)